MQSTESLTSLSSKVINTATPPPVEDLHGLLETSSDLADYRLDEATAEEEEAANQPCFMGICLPRNILNLFPRRALVKPYVAIDLDTEIAAASNAALPDESSSLSPSIVVDETDHVMVKRRRRGGGAGVNEADEVDGGEGGAAAAAAITNPDQEPMTKLCLNCSRTTTTTAATKTSTANATKTSSSSSSNSSNLVIPTDPSGGAAAASPPSLSKHHEKLILLRNVTDSKRIKGGTLSLASADGVTVTEEDHELIAILVNVQRCANPVLMKQAKLNLLELKQKHAEHFQDLCLYSEVLNAIGRNTYRQSARRFLQELFLDIEFEQLLGEMSELLRVSERRPKEAAAGSLPLSVRSGPGRDTTSYGSMIHSVELRNGRRECEKIDEEDFGVIKGGGGGVIGIRKSLPEPIVSPSRSHVSESGASGDSETSTANGGTGGGGGVGTVGSLGKGFARVQLSCSVNKFPVKRDRANSLNAAPTTAKDY